MRTAQPSLSQQIRRLEDDVGVPLFERDRHNVQLTMAGEAFLRDARDIIARADQSMTTAREVAAGRIGRLRLACSFGSFDARLASRLASYSRQNPGITIESHTLSGSAALEGLLRESIDIALVPSLPPAEARARGLIQRPFSTSPLTFVGVDRILPEKRNLSFEDVHDRRLLLPARRAESILHETIRNVFGDSQLALSSIQEVDDAPALIGLAAAGFGVGIIPASWQTYHLSGATFVLADSSIAIAYAFHYRTDVGNVVLETFVDSLEV